LAAEADKAQQVRVDSQNLAAAAAAAAATVKAVRPETGAVRCMVRVAEAEAEES
jgi:hypothetical protein